MAAEACVRAGEKVPSFNMVEWRRGVIGKWLVGRGRYEGKWKSGVEREWRNPEGRNEGGKLRL